MEYGYAENITDTATVSSSRTLPLTHSYMCAHRKHNTRCRSHTQEVMTVQVQFLHQNKHKKVNRSHRLHIIIVTVLGLHLGAPKDHSIEDCRHEKTRETNANPDNRTQGQWSTFKHTIHGPDIFAPNRRPLQIPYCSRAHTSHLHHKRTLMNGNRTSVTSTYTHTNTYVTHVCVYMPTHTHTQYIQFSLCTHKHAYTDMYSMHTHVQVGCTYAHTQLHYTQCMCRETETQTQSQTQTHTGWQVCIPGKTQTQTHSTDIYTHTYINTQTERQI